jgi:hypothetical protein
MDNRTIASFKRSIRDLNHYIQQLNTELFKISLKQYSLEKTLVDKGVLDNNDTNNSLKGVLKSSNSSNTVGGDSLSHSATLEALANMAKKNERKVKVINN